MLASDQLLMFLSDGEGNVSRRMAATGYTEDEVRGAWNYCRQAVFTEATGSGADRLTEAGNPSPNQPSR